MTFEEMRVFARDQLPNYMDEGHLDRDKFVGDVMKNYGLSKKSACKLVDSLDVDSRRSGT